MMLYASDLVLQYLPWYYLVSQSIKQFQFPHWLNSIYGWGYPILAQGETGVLSPINTLILFLFPYPFSVNILYLAYTTIAISGVFYFLKAHKIDNLSSLFGAITFILSGFFLSRYIHPSIFFTGALLPWGFYIIKKSNVNKKIIYFLAPLIYLQLTAGHLQIAIISMSAYSLYTIILNVIYSQRFLYVLKVGIIMILGLTLSSIQLMPSLKLFQISQRLNWDKNLIYSYSLPYSQLITYVHPNAFGISKPGNDIGFTQIGGGFVEVNITLWTIPFIISMLPLILLVNKRIYNKDLKIAVAVFYFMWIVFILLSLGGYFKPNLIFAKIPYFPFRASARYMLVSTFAASVLAGIGFSKIRQMISIKLSILLFLLFTSISIFQISFLMHDYFIFKNQNTVMEDIHYNINNNKLWTPLGLDPLIKVKNTQIQMKKIFKNEFYKGSIVSLVSLAILIIWWKKDKKIDYLVTSHFSK